MAKKYLGDAVYVDFERGMLKLTTEDGASTTNTIYLEGSVYDALVRFVRQLRAIDMVDDVPPQQDG